MRAYLNYILKPWFLIICVIVLLHQILEKIGHIYIPFISAYLDPLLMMPIVLHLSLWERRLFFYKNIRFIFSPFDLAIYWIVISLITEILFPLLNKYFVADMGDVLCYLVGTCVFGLFLNKPIKA